MKVPAKGIAVILAVLTVAAIVLSARYLYVTPIPNTWTWWPGDETWLLSEYHAFVTTGHYVNLLAPGSVYAQCSGLVFGSCYLTAALYAVPLLLFHGHSIDTGRTITFFLSLLTLVSVWQLAKRYGVPELLRAFGVLLLASTLCFFITSHSARADMFVGLAVLLVVGLLPFVTEHGNPNSDILLGLLLPIVLLVNGHVLILTFLAIGYIAWRTGVFRSWRSTLRSAGAAAGGFAILLLVQWAVLGSLSITGPFANGPGVMPYKRLFHLQANLSNYEWRIFIANVWAPGVMWLAVLLAAGFLWAILRKNLRVKSFPPAVRRLFAMVALVVLNSIYIEYYWPRSLIYVLPAIVLLILVASVHLFRILPRNTKLGLAVGMVACLAFGLWNYTIIAMQMGKAGEIITNANRQAFTGALAAIHAHSTGRPRVFSTVPGEAVAMDDDSCQLLTPVLYDWPVDSTATKRELWDRASISFAIACAPGNHFADHSPNPDSLIDVVASSANLIFQRVGTFCDIDRPYDLTSFTLQDTLRVYKFH